MNDWYSMLISLAGTVALMLFSFACHRGAVFLQSRAEHAQESTARERGARIVAMLGEIAEGIAARHLEDRRIDMMSMLSDGLELAKQRLPGAISVADVSDTVLQRTLKDLVDAKVHEGKLVEAGAQILPGGRKA